MDYVPLRPPPASHYFFSTAASVSKYAFSHHFQAEEALFAPLGDEKGKVTSSGQHFLPSFHLSLSERHFWFVFCKESYCGHWIQT
jgi:hypothetical protein